MNVRFNPFRFLLPISLLALLSCDSPIAMLNSPIEKQAPPNASAKLHVNVHVGSSNGDDMYCSIEDHGVAAALVCESVSWSWDALGSDVDGKGPNFFSGRSNFLPLREFPRYRILPPIPKLRQKERGRVGAEFFGFGFSLEDKDRFLAGFSSGKIKLTLIVKASSDLAPKEFKANIFIDLPLREGANCRAEIPLQ